MSEERSTLAPGAQSAGAQPEGDWIEGQLAELRERTERMGRELGGLRGALQEQQRGSSELQGALAVVEGRTRRHEAGQELARFVQQQLGVVTERLEEEAALRRDQRGALEREQHRDREAGESGAAALDELAERLHALEQHVSGESERQRRLADDRAAAERAEERLAERIAATEGRLAALAEAWAGEREERARFDAALPGLGAALDELDARTVALRAELRAELRRSEDDIAKVRARRDREDDLIELVEQQRSTRIRLEERLSALESRVEEAVQGLGSASEERLGLGRQLTGVEERLRALGESIEAQRWAVLEHFGRLLEADEAVSRKQIDELELCIRERRRLLVGAARGQRAGRRGAAAVRGAASRAAGGRCS